MSTTIHDHHLLEMNVSATARTIRFRTAYPEAGGPEFADVLFDGVAAYAFRGDALGTILFGIEIVEATALYREFGGDMQRARAQSGGHAPWARSQSEAEVFFAAGDIRGYRVSSSIGLEGAAVPMGLVCQ